MPIPDFQTVMLPLLRLTADGQEHTLSGSVETISKEFNLTLEEMKELLPSGKGTRVYSRVVWAKTYLVRASLLAATGRGRFIITERGFSVLKRKPSRIDMKFLEQFPEYLEFRAVSSKSESSGLSGIEEIRDPNEILGSIYQDLRKALAQELLENIKNSTPQFFEQLVIDLLVAMGYGGSWQDAAKAVGGTGDEGIDGVIKEDKLGLDAIYIQAKRWEGTVGRPIIQAFAGSLEGQRAKKGVFITTSDFSQTAKDFVTHIEKKIVLIDGEQLAQLMIDHNIGVTEVIRYEIKRVDTDYFDEA